MELHLQIIEKSHDEGVKGESKASLVKTNEQNRVTWRMSRGFLGAEG